MSDRKYYRIKKNSPVMSVIKDAVKKQSEFRDALKALQEEFNAPIYTAGSHHFAGVAFPGDPPAGWRKGKQYCTPDKRIKAGKDLAKRFDSLPIGVDGWRLSGMLNRTLDGKYTHWADNMIHFTSFEKYGNTHILSVPARCEVDPPGCVALKMSEYWEIREAAA